MYSKWQTERSSRPRNGTTLKKAALAALLACAVAVASGCSVLPAEGEEEVLPTINPPKLSKKPEYEVKTETLETKVRGFGKMMATKEEELYFTLGGKRMKEVFVQTGDAVTEGQLIAELDMTEEEKQLRNKRLELRKDELLMKETLRDPEKSPEQIEQAKVDFEMKRQAIADLEEQLAQAKLTAPFSGTVVALYKKKGDSPQSYETLGVIADLSKLTVAVSLTNEDLKKIAVDMEAVVEINSAGEQKGKVKQLPVPKEGSQSGGGFPGNGGQQDNDSLSNYTLVELEKMPEGLNRGTPLSASIILSRKEKAIVIPLAALRSITGRNYVQVIDASGAKREVDVEIGQQTSTVVEIVKGLQPGQKVVGR